MEGEAPLVREAVGEALVVELIESDVEGEGASVPVPLEVGVPVDVPEGVRDAVALLERDTLPVLLAEAPGVSEAVGEAVTVLLLAESVVEGVRELVPVPLGVGVPAPVPVGISFAVAEPDRLVLPLLLAEAPSVSEAVGDADTVELPESVEEGIAWDSEAEAEGVGELPAGLAAPLVELVLAPMVPLADAPREAAGGEAGAVGLAVGETVAVAVAGATASEGEGEGVGVGLGGCEGVPLSGAPVEAEGVGVGEAEGVGEGVAASVSEAVPDAEGVGVADKVSVEEPLPVPVPLREVDAVLLALPPAERVVVGVGVRVVVVEAVVVPVGDTVWDAVPVVVPLGLCEGVGGLVWEGLCVGLCEGVSLEVAVLERTPLREAVGVAVRVTVWEGVGVPVRVPLREAVAVAARVTLWEGVGVPVRVPLREAVGVPVRVTLWEDVRVADWEGVGVPDWVPVGVGVGAMEPAGEAEALLVGVGVGILLLLGEGVGDALGVALGGRQALPQDRSRMYPGGHTGVRARTQCRSTTYSTPVLQSLAMPEGALKFALVPMPSPGSSVGLLAGEPAMTLGAPPPRGTATTLPPLGQATNSVPLASSVMPLG